MRGEDENVNWRKDSGKWQIDVEGLHRERLANMQTSRYTTACLQETVQTYPSPSRTAHGKGASYDGTEDSSGSPGETNKSVVDSRLLGGRKDRDVIQSSSLS